MTILITSNVEFFSHMLLIAQNG